MGRSWGDRQQIEYIRRVDRSLAVRYIRLCKDSLLMPGPCKRLVKTYIGFVWELEEDSRLRTVSFSCDTGITLFTQPLSLEKVRSASLFSLRSSLISWLHNPIKLLCMVFYYCRGYGVQAPHPSWIILDSGCSRQTGSID